MSALHQIETLESPRSLKRRSHQRPYHRHAQGGVALELTLKLLVNSILSVAALTALIKLLPHHISQQSKLREIRIEVRQTEQRVDKLRDNFSRNFDPQEAKKVMQEQNPRIAPNQLRIVWLNRQTPRANPSNSNY